jgi:hypothetical protein
MWAMNEESLSARIERLVAEEHELRRREEEDRSLGDLLAVERERLQTVEAELDRAWELLRQRRAFRGGGGES